MRVLFIHLFFLSYVCFCQNPTLQWVKDIGGTTNDEGFSITVDPSGNVYTTGSFGNVVDFDPGPSTFTFSATPNFAVFIQKLDGSGNFIWARQIAGNNDNTVGSICLDQSGNIYITGSFKGITDFDPGPGTFTLASKGNTDVFILKLNSSGNFMSAFQMGGVGDDEGRSIDIDYSGNILTTGYFSNSSDFDPGLGTYILTSGAWWDMFITKLDPFGNLIWVVQLNGYYSEVGNGIKTDSYGNVYTTGTFQGPADFDPGPGVYTLNNTFGSADIFVWKLDPLGNLIWAKDFGFGNFDYGNSIALDASGYPYVTGIFQQTVDFDPGPGTYTLMSYGNLDVFILKLDPLGNFVLAKQLGGTSTDIGKSIAVDTRKNIYTTGTFYNTADFDPGIGLDTLSSGGSYGIFVSKLDSLGNFIWAGTSIGAGGDRGNCITLDATGNNIYTTGGYSNLIDLDLGPGTFTLTSPGNEEIYVHKMNQSSLVVNETSPQIKSAFVYPSPTAGLFTMQLLISAHLTITNTLGLEILNESKPEGKHQINLQDQPSGIYFVRVTCYERQETFKVVKE